MELRERPEANEKENQEFEAWVDEVQEKNDNYFKTFEEAMPLFADFGKKSAHRQTLLALLGFLTHLATLKNALIDLSKTNNIYAAKAIYRIFLEHWLKGTYIWTRYLEEQNDDVGMEYNSIGQIGESLKYGNSINQISLIIDAEAKNIDVWGILCSYNSELKKLNKRDMTRNIQKFEYKHIAKYLFDKKAPGSDWIPAIISEYSELSSFVHGGPSASREYSSKLYNSQFEEYRGMIRFSFNMCRLFLYSILALILKDFDGEKKERIIFLLSQLRDEKQGI